MSDSHHHSAPEPTSSYDPSPVALNTHQQTMHDMGHREFMASDPSVAKPWDGRRTLVLAYVLWLFVGGIGGHRLYAGQFKSGFLMLGLGILTFIFTSMLGPMPGIPMFIWWVVDAFLIPGWIKRANEQNALKAPIVETV